MRILQITSHLHIGGISRYVLSLSKQLQAQGHSVIIASDGGDLESQVRAMGMIHWRLPFNTSAELSLQVVRGMRELTRHLQQEPVDLIHAHTRVGQVVADRISRRLHIPYVTTWHGIYKRRLSRRLWPCTGRLTIAISSPVRQHLVRDFGVPEERIRLVYNGIDVQHYAAPPDVQAVRFYRQQLKIPTDSPVIGSTGRLAAGRVKGFDVLLAAASILKKRFPNLRVLVVGDGPRRPFLEDVARRLRILDLIHFAGQSQDVRVPLAVMDLFVFSSRWPEAFGLTLVEAMAAGKPIVATRVGAVPEIVQHGESGWLVPQEDPAQLAQGIALLLSDRSLAKKLGQQARQRVLELFDVHRMVSQIEAVYREVVHEGHSGP